MVKPTVGRELGIIAQNVTSAELSVLTQLGFTGEGKQKPITQDLEQAITEGNDTVSESDAAPAPEPTPAPTPEPAPVATQSVFDESILKKLQEEIAQKQDDLNNLRATVTDLKMDLSASRESLEQAAREKDALAKTKEEVESRLQKLEAFVSVSKSVGITNGGGESKVLEVLGSGSPESRKFIKLVEQGEKAAFRSSQLANNFGTYSYSVESDRFWAANRTRIHEGIEAELRDKGFLKGRNVTTQALTLVGDLPHTAFDHFSAMIRTSHFPELILWQFAAQNTQLGINPQRGVKNFSFPRYRELAKPVSKASRTLNPANTISPNSWGFTESLIPAEILELGIGAAQNPIGLSEFAMAFSLVELESMVSVSLIRDYAATKNVALQEEIFRTDRQVYNNNDAEVVEAPADVTANGQLTRQFLTKLYAYTRAQKTVPTLPDGKFILITNPDGFSQILEGLDSAERYLTPTYIDIIGNYLTGSRSDFTGGEVSGYKGSFNGFHVFEQNVFGLGTVSPDDPGTFTETIDGVSHTTVQSFVMGPEAIGWATAMPAQVRFDEVTDFMRQRRAIWISHENSVSLDVKNDALDPLKEQMRVIGVRHTVKPVA